MATVARQACDDRKKASTAELQAFALDLRKQGLSYEKIGVSLGKQFRATEEAYTQVYAAKLVKAAIKSIYSEQASELVKLEMERLDDWQMEAIEVMRASHVMVSNGAIVKQLVYGADGRPVMDANTGLPVSVAIEDDGPRLAAIDRLLKIQERRAKLLGLDKPTKVASTNPAGDKPSAAVIMVSETDAKL